MARQPDKTNQDWTTSFQSVEAASLHVLMDIRQELRDQNQELRRLNAVLNCHNFLRIPRVLDRISRNTAKKRRAKKK